MKAEVSKFSFTCSEGLIDRVEKEVIEPVRNACGLKLNRSKLIQIFFEIAASQTDKLNLNQVIDYESFKREFRRALQLTDQSEQAQ